MQREKCNRRSVKGGVQGEMQEVECIAEKDTLDVFKHARWPAATCGSKLPAASFRAGPGGRGVHAREGCPSVGVLAVFCWCFAGRGAQRDYL